MNNLDDALDNPEALAICLEFLRKEEKTDPSWWRVRLLLEARHTKLTAERTPTPAKRVRQFQERPDPAEAFRTVRWAAGDEFVFLAGFDDSTAHGPQPVPQASVPRNRWRLSDGRIEILIDDNPAILPFWMPLESGDWLCFWQNGNFGVYCDEEFTDQYEETRT